MTFTDEHLKKALDFENCNHIDEDENVLILVAILLYPKVLHDLGV